MLRPSRVAHGRKAVIIDPSTSEQSAFTRLGGRTAVEGIVSDFIDRVVGDLMIGFFFKKVPIPRLKQLEVEFACEHLGADTKYSGRPLRTAHGPHRIMGGQFNRRLRLLEQTLLDHQVPSDIIEHWMAHNEAMRAQVTLDGPFACNGELPDPHLGRDPGPGSGGGPEG